MNWLKSIVIENSSIINDDTYEESYYDRYWKFVIKNKLIFLPENKIIFWGFQIELTQNEYDLLKSIISLNSSNYSEKGYTAEKILKSVNYRRNNLETPKNIAFTRNVITLKSSIKKKILDKVVELSVNLIKENRYNPFVVGTKKDKRIKGNIEKICQDMLNDKKLRDKISRSGLNLVMLLPYLKEFISHYDLYYSSFYLNKAIDELIRPVKSQKHCSKLRYFQTDFYFYALPMPHKSRPMPKTRDNKKPKSDRLNYAPIKFKYNLCDFVTDLG